MENFKAKAESILEKGEQFCEDHPYLVACAMSVLGAAIAVNSAYDYGYQKGQLELLSKTYEMMAEQKS